MAKVSRRSRRFSQIYAPNSAKICGFCGKMATNYINNMLSTFLKTGFFLACAQFSFAQQNPHNLDIINNQQAYKASVRADTSDQLVEIKKYIPGIYLDIRYATTNNFTGKVMYNQPRAFARLPVVRALQEVQKELNQEGLSLKIFDAYRPYAVTLKFYEAASIKAFVADPKKGSRHNRGCAIDLTIVKKRNGKELPMPTGYDSFSELASPTFSNLPENKKKNRDLLILVMEKHGFRVIENEWWHFDFKDWNHFSLMDIPFEEL